MKKRMIILLFAAIMGIGACTPKQADIPVTAEGTDAMEDTVAAEDREKESTSETGNAMEEESFTKKSTDRLSFQLNIAELRPEGAWSVGDNKVCFAVEGI